MTVDSRDRGILRELARNVAEIAALPVQQETVSLWKALNGLKPVRPMVMVDQIPWHEMDCDGELTLRCEDEFCRGIETDLRRTLYRWKHMRVDMVVEPMVRIAQTIDWEDFGIQMVEHVAVTDAASGIQSHHYIDQLKNEEDIQKIRTPQVRLCKEATAQAKEAALEIFDGLLEVRMQGVEYRFDPWDKIVEWRSPEVLLMDLAVRPEFMHLIITRLVEANLAVLDQLEAGGMVGGDQATIHCTGAFTDELPADGYDPAKPRAKDVWTSGMAQIFGSVSPAMHQEFELAYAEQWYSRFGLVYYGCCEPLHKKIDIVRRIPHLRKISMSPWVVQEEGASQIGPDFVFSRKPSPAFLARDTWSPQLVEQDLRETVDCCRRHHCPLELILKDISTVRYEPQRLWQWADIAMKTVC